MRKAKFATSIAALGLVSVALAGEKTHTSIAIIVEDGQGDETRIELDSAELGFNLHEMQHGENRSVVDDSGRTILITRKANGYSFEVDGKTIDVPIVHADHAANVVVHSDPVEDVDVQVMSRGHGIVTDIQDVTMVLTADPVDTATQDAIRSLLEAAGHGDNVHFVDRQNVHEDTHEVRVVKKVVEVSED